ncbi:MAG: RHS repeat protein [Bryobacterales bacterium]|nr:RHS repeat protein [Bryobacterales bacterium]
MAGSTDSIDKNGNSIELREYDWESYNSVPSAFDLGNSVIRETQYTSFGNPSIVKDEWQYADSSRGYTEYAYDAGIPGCPFGNGALLCCTPPSPWGANTASSGVAKVDYNSEVQVLTDQWRQTRTLTYDALDRLVQVTDGAGTTYYTYDALDNLTYVCQNGTPPASVCTGGQKRTFVYSSLKCLVSATNPESGTTTYTYGCPLPPVDFGGLACRDPTLGPQSYHSWVGTVICPSRVRRYGSVCYTGEAGV